MSRKTFLAFLTLFAVLEVAVLATARLGHSRRNPATASDLAQGSSGPTQGVAPRLYVEPEAGFTWLYDLVNHAKTSIDMTMYELVDTTFSADLVQACQRGVLVRVILDQNLEKAANTPAYNQLAAAGPNCKVVWADPQFQATHEKALLIDGKTAAVLTFNLTSRYYTDTRDMAQTVTDLVDVNAIERTFKYDFMAASGTPAQPNPDPDWAESLDPYPGHDLIWSPTTAQDDLVSLIGQAKSSLVVENEELGAASIVDALAAACKRGVQVQLAMTDTSANYHANYTTLQAAGCGVHLGADNNNTLYIHAKAIVADLGTPQAIGYLGSINFSVASMTKNRELGLYVHQPGLLNQMNSTMLSDYNHFPTYSGKSVERGRRGTGERRQETAVRSEEWEVK